MTKSPSPTKKIAAVSLPRPRMARMRKLPMPPRKTIPASTPINRMLSPMSAFTMWLNSWPITPWSSSRLSVSSAPRVTAMTAFDTSHPAAKALMPFSSSMT